MVEKVFGVQVGPDYPMLKFFSQLEWIKEYTPHKDNILGFAYTL